MTRGTDRLRAIEQGLGPVMEAFDREGIAFGVVNLGGDIMAVATRPGGRTAYITDRQDFDNRRGYVFGWADIEPDDETRAAFRVFPTASAVAAHVRRQGIGSSRRKLWARGRTASRVARRAGRR